MSRTRLKPEERRERILSAALELARRDGYQHIKREDVAELAGTSLALVSHYFGTMPQLKRDVMRAAVRLRDAAVVAQGLAARDAHAQKADDTLKRAALEAL